MLPRRPWWWGTVAAEAAGVAWRVARAAAAGHEHGTVNTVHMHATFSYLKQARSTRQHSQNHTGGSQNRRKDARTSGQARDSVDLVSGAVIVSI